MSRENNLNLGSLKNAECVEAVNKLLGNPKIRKALSQTVSEQDNRIFEQVKLAQIPSPTFKESKRGEAFKKMLLNTGIADIVQDESGNVIGRFKGTKNSPTLVLAAHLDTVFPEAMPTQVIQIGNTFYGAGISDDAGGLASLLQIARCLCTQQIQTVGDIVFVGTVGEEGNGDLYGSKTLWSNPNDYDGMIAIDSADVHHLLKGSIGCKRYRITFKGKGGDDFLDFSRVCSAIHGISRLVNKIDFLALHNSSCCTFNVGTISASNSSDRIADHAEIEIEIRSHDPKVLKQISEELFSLVEESIKEENGHWNQHGDGKLSAKIEKTGDRPASSSLEDSPVLTASYAAMLGLGIELRRFDFGATDQNIPLSMGIPATTHGAGGSEDFGHSLKEKWDSSDAYLGPQLTFLTAVSLVGLNNITKPILQKRPYRNTAFSRNIYSN